MHIGPFRQPVGDGCPISSGVASLKDIWFEIVEPVTVDRDVRGGGVEMRGINQTDTTPFRHAGCDAGPGGAVIGCDVEKSIVGPGPKQAFFQGRFREGENDVVVFDAGNVVLDWSATWFLLALIVAGEVFTNRRPAMALV